MSEKTFNKTLIIGLGLIGGSFAKTLRQHNISNKIYAFDLDPDTLENAIKSGTIDDFTMLDDNISDFDFIVLATPLSAYKIIAEKLKNRTAPNAVIIDLGSVKNVTIKKTLGLNFIPCHPIAGLEKGGFANSDAKLFIGKKFIICPENCDKNAVEKVATIVKKIAAEVEFLDAKKHDEIYALVSHLPQFLSFLTKDFSPKKISDEFFKSAFRLDNSDPEIWGDIFKLNEKNLEKFYLKFFDNLEQNIEKISSKSSDSELIQNLISIADKSTPATTTQQFTENFAAIFFRALVVKSYLDIPEIKTCQHYVGSGFRDFTSILNIINFDREKLSELIAKNRPQIIKFFNSFS